MSVGNLIFSNIMNLRLRNINIELDFHEMKNKKLMFFSAPILLFSLISSCAVMIFQFYFYINNIEIIFFKFNVIMTCIALLLYFLFIIISYKSKNIKTNRWMNYIVFYFQIFVIMAFRFAIFRVVNVTSILLFFQYLIEIMVRLLWVIIFIHSFMESLVLNLMSLATVWIVVPLLIPRQFYYDEIMNTLNYSFVIFAVIAINYIIERKQKEAFYYKWQAEDRVKCLTNTLENLSSGFVSLKRGKINFINSYLKELLLNEIFWENETKRKNSNKYRGSCTNTESKNFMFLKSF
jgi:hypothetical protein